MTAYQIVANGRPFIVYALTLEAAMIVCAAHIAWQARVRTIESVRRIA